MSEYEKLMLLAMAKILEALSSITESQTQYRECQKVADEIRGEIRRW